MRNGNTVLTPLFQLLTLRSYRTYEEWKHALMRLVCPTVQGSYRTYEEWKLFSCIFQKVINLLFLPYLWGMETSLSVEIKPSTVARFLPYLWGMETYDTPSVYVFAFQVLTVPMRNGNSHRRYTLCHQLLRSYRTYEEWKPFFRW